MVAFSVDFSVIFLPGYAEIIAVNESFDSKDSVDEDITKKRRRRNSIPELVGEAKKFVLGISKKENKLKDRRGTLKQIQMPTYELPELEEKAELDVDRRHSVDATVVLHDSAELNMSFQRDTPVLEMEPLNLGPEVQLWWKELCAET